jgi:thiamine pyrophosphate-dependent acetolactate synthase large subunit-like protein
MIQVVMVDNALTQVKSRQQQFGFGTQATSFQSIDYSAVARSLGIEAIRADTVASFREAVRQALDANRPVTIETMLDASEYTRMPSRP